MNENRERSENVFEPDEACVASIDVLEQKRRIAKAFYNRMSLIRFLRPAEDCLPPLGNNVPKIVAKWLLLTSPDGLS